MKAAVLLSGQTRTFEANYYSMFEYVTQGLDFDCFIHTWDKSGRVIHTHVDYDQSSDAKIDIVKEIYKPKKIIVENQDEFCSTINKEKYQERTPHGMRGINIICQWYSLYRSMQNMIDYVVATGTKYDLIIRVRFDMLFKSSLNIKDNFSFFTEPNTVIMPADEHFGSRPEYVCNDRFAAGGTKEMGVYSSLYTKLQEAIDDHRMIQFHPETLVGWNLQNNGIKWKTVNFESTLVR